MAEQLTPQQKLAVENRGGKLLISAAAGSGKTKVLVDRLMSYLTDANAPANLDDFLIITYTKAAASELRGKISAKLTEYITEHPENRHLQQQIQRLHLAKISTVHGFCGELLREYAYRLDISSDFRIAEENECREMMLQILQQLLDEAYNDYLEDEAFRTFIDTQGLGRDDRQIPEILLQIYTSALCHLDPDAWLNWCLKSAYVESISDASQTVWGAYLIRDLQDYLALQISSLENCIQLAEDVPGMEKPVTLLSTTVECLRSLAQCGTWDEIVNHSPVDYGTLTFKKEHKGTQLAERIKAVRNSCKEDLPKKLRVFSDPSRVVLAHLNESALAADGLIRLVKEFRKRYLQHKKARRVLDFSDIEQLTLDLLLGKHRTGITSVAEEVGSRFREIMVDEYQDSNEVQDAIFSALSQQRQNCFMVGDVKQSIYQFRLADPGIFLEKYHSYVSAEDALPGEGRRILLSNNFRSSGGVISAVNDVFSECMSPNVGGLWYGEEEMLREGVPHIPLPEPEVSLYAIDVKADTYEEEAAVVAGKISELLDGNHMVRQGDTLRPITEDDIVILLRSPGSVGGEFRFALETAGIPCTMGTDIDLLQIPEVETLRSILQIIHNPLQDIPMIAAITSPVFGFSADDLAMIRSGDRYSSFYHALQNSKHAKARKFLDLFTSLRTDARFFTVTQLIHQIFIRTGMLSIYGAMQRGEEAVSHLQSFCQIAADYESTGRKDLSYFLEYLTAMEEKGLSVSGNTPAGAVRIMSIHKSKGLEFPVVFLCGLSRMFNMSDTQKQVLCHKDLGLGLIHTNQKQRVRVPTIAKRAIATKIAAETIAEELRVLYVAMTRARDRLIMTYAAAKLSDRLLDVSLRLDLCARELLTAHVNCPGSWILLSALQRTEAGELFQMSDKPDCSQVKEYAWSIHVVEAKEIMISSENTTGDSNGLSQNNVEKIRRGLSFVYSYDALAKIPSKLTATQLKGRTKDHEIAEFAGVPKNDTLTFRSPIRKSEKHSGTEFGKAMHSVMQYLRFPCCATLSNLENDIDRMVQTNLITLEQANMVDLSRIYRFFQSDLGRRLIAGKEVLREFKFSILEDISKYHKDLSGDSILMQGVIDCALIEDSGITVLDFKTDWITEENLHDKIALYRDQVLTYAAALSRNYEKPVVASYIYFFSSEQLVAIE